jgi:hypothetical protein
MIGAGGPAGTRPLEHSNRVPFVIIWRYRYVLLSVRLDLRILLFIPYVSLAKKTTRRLFHSPSCVAVFLAKPSSPLTLSFNEEKNEKKHLAFNSDLP